MEQTQITITIKVTEEELDLYFISSHLRFQREINNRGEQARIGDVAKELSSDFIKSFGMNSGLYFQLMGKIKRQSVPILDQIVKE